MPVRVNTSVHWKNQNALHALCTAIAASAKLTGRNANMLKGKIRRIIIDDNIDKLMNRSVDRYGKPCAKLAKSTLADPKRGPGPALVPNFMHSRFISRFRAEWQPARFFGVAVLDMKWIGMPWAKYHITGTRRMPRRDPSGITPKGWSQIRYVFHEWTKDVMSGK